MTHTLSLSEVKMKLSKIVDGVVSKEDEIIITRNGKPAAVILSAEEYGSWKETQEILSNPSLMKEIEENLRALQKGQSKKYTLEQLFGADLK